MAIRNSLQEAEDKVAQHKVGGFNSEDDRKSFTGIYASGSIAQVISDVRTIFGAVRVPEYTISSMSEANKITTGVMSAESNMRINQDLWDDVYTTANSFIVHEGVDGKFVINDSKLYHFVCGVGNTTDFVEFQNALERHMAYLYIATAGDETETAAALGDYNTYKGNLS